MVDNRPLSTVKFYRGVPVTEDDVLMFNSREEQEDWFEQYHAPEFDMFDSYYVKINEGVLKTPFRLEDLQTCNFIRIENPSYIASVIGNDVWWCYLDVVEYSSSDGVSKAMTLARYSPSLTQTCQFDMKMLNCFVNKTHQNEYLKEDDNLGYPKPDPEFLNSSGWFSAEGYGSDGVSELTKQQRVLFGDGDVRDEVAFMVLSFAINPSLADGGGDVPLVTGGSVVGAPTQATYSIIPFSSITKEILDTDFKLNSSTVTINSGLGSHYTNEFLKNLAMDKAFAGNNIGYVTSYVTRTIGYPYTFNSLTRKLVVDMSEEHIAASIKAQPISGTPAFQMASVEKLLVFKPEDGLTEDQKTPWQLLYEMYKNSTLFPIYGKYPPIKVFKEPFFSLVVDNSRGIQGNITVDWFNPTYLLAPMKFFRQGSIGVSEVEQYFLEGYGFKTHLDQSPTTDTKAQPSLTSQQAFLSWISNIDTSFVSFTDALTAYIGATRNSRAVNVNNANINYQNQLASSRVQMQNQNTMNQAGTANANLSNQNANNQLTNAMMYQNQQNSLNQVTGAASGAAQGFMSGGLPGMGVGTAAAGVDIMQQSYLTGANFDRLMNNNLSQQHASNQALANMQGATTANLGRSLDLSNRIAGSQRDMTIASINAGVQDMRYASPNMSGHGTSVSSDYGNYNVSLNVQSWKAKDGSIQSALTPLMMYGVSLTNYGDPMALINNHKRKKFNYIQTVGVPVISTKYNEKFTVAWQALFDRGVTLWWDKEAYKTRDILGNTQVNLS